MNATLRNPINARYTQMMGAAETFSTKSIPRASCKIPCTMPMQNMVLLATSISYFASAQSNKAQSFARYQSAGSGRYCCPFWPASEARNPRSPAVNTQIGAIELSATETAVFVGDSTSNAAGETVSSKPACGTGV